METGAGCVTGGVCGQRIKVSLLNACLMLGDPKPTSLETHECAVMSYHLTPMLSCSPIVRDISVSGSHELCGAIGLPVDSPGLGDSCFTLQLLVSTVDWLQVDAASVSAKSG